MDANELSKKPPMAAPGFTTLTPKAETDYDKKIQEEQDKQMRDCCGEGTRRHGYDQYGYRPRSQNPEPTPDSEPQPAPPTDKKSSKR